MQEASSALISLHCNGNMPSDPFVLHHDDGSYSVTVFIGRNRLTIDGSLRELKSIATAILCAQSQAVNSNGQKEKGSAKAY